jgi:hypothetical protein
VKTSNLTEAIRVCISDEVLIQSLERTEAFSTYYNCHNNESASMLEHFLSLIPASAIHRSLRLKYFKEHHYFEIDNVHTRCALLTPSTKKMK